ncbi:hypothetical protein CPB84DRAFT_1752551 [Gymnopilus junonius]|uniref:Uncharacterized protein n=1 Tax=Gymnopilus junonius TaxID=109634 RepID=A0A9P5TFV6_GYMJU|nr:hypothetical protein CPB84DRAFT_1752551 [Gymnopilus junonius]
MAGVSEIIGRIINELKDEVEPYRKVQMAEDQVICDGFGTVVNALGICIKPYLTQIISTILWHLNNKMLGLVLFEQLGEEYPDTLGSIITAEGAIANIIGMTMMDPHQGFM